MVFCVALRRGQRFIVMGACRNLSREEVQAVARELGHSRNPERDRTLFLLGCYAGGRVSSLLSLRICDIVEPSGFPVSVLVFRRATVKRKRQSHYVHLSMECQSILGNYLDYLRSICRIEDKGYAFTTRWGTSPLTRGHAYCLINEAAKKISLGGVIGTHTMRKTFAANYYEQASAAYKAGMINEEPLELLRRALGHQSINSKAKYLATCQDTVNQFSRSISYL
jgi:integrase